MGLSGKIAFSSGRATDFDIWLIDLNHGSLRQLTHGDNLNDFPVFSRDGARIAYISTEADMIPSLWVMNSDGSDKLKLSEGVYCQHPAWLPDGNRLLCGINSADGSNIDLGIFNMDESSQFKPQIVATRRGNDCFPDVSPCSSKVVFSAFGSDNNSEIVELDLGSGKEKVLASHPAHDTCPRYSPDGKSISFVSYRESYDTSGAVALEKQITEAVKTGNLQEVNRLIIARRKLVSDSEIFVMDSSGENVRQLTSNKTTDSALCWSPCGRYILHTGMKRNQPETERLQILDLQTRNDGPLDFDRSALEREIGATSALNASVFQKLVPNWIERRMVPRSFWGEERNPSWAA